MNHNLKIKFLVITPCNKNLQSVKNSAAHKFVPVGCHGKFFKKNYMEQKFSHILQR